MKKITTFLFLFCLGIVYGQNPKSMTEVFCSSDYVSQILTSEAINSNFVSETKMLGGLQIFSDRATYLAQCNNGDSLVLEDFTGGPTELLSCDDVLSAAGDTCYPAGALEEGFEVTVSNLGDGGTIYIDPSSGFDNLDPVVGSNALEDFTIINFTGADPVTSFGFDLYALLGGTNAVDVRIIGTAGLIATSTVNVTTSGPLFFGVISGEEVVSVELENLSLDDIEVIGQLLFGTCEDLGGGPVNDDCENAIALECGTTVTGSTEDATDSGSEPSPDVFYTYTGNGVAEDVTLSLCDGGTLFDTVLSVFDDGCALVNEIAFNDDSCNLQSELTFESDGTTTYTILLEGFSEVDTGSYALTTSCDAILNVNETTFEGFTMFPNPASTALNLEARNNMENITIINMLGQQVLSRNIQAANAMIDVSGLSSGAYFIKVAIDGNQATYKFIKN